MDLAVRYNFFLLKQYFLYKERKYKMDAWMGGWIDRALRSSEVFLA